jgi:hypothetical protein
MTAEIISYAVWLYHVFSLNLRGVERLLAELEAVPTGISAKRLLDAGAVLSMCHAAASSASSEQAEHRSPRLAAAAPEAQKRAGDRNGRGEGKL